MCVREIPSTILEKEKEKEKEKERRGPIFEASSKE